MSTPIVSDSVNGNQPYLSLGSAARHCGVSIHALRRASNSGRIRCWTLPSGHRRYIQSDLEGFLKENKINGNGSHGNGIANSIEKGKRNLICYARVSSRSRAVGWNQSLNQQQDGSSDIQRQLEKLELYCESEYGKKPDVVVTEVASGTNFNRKGFSRLMNRIMSGEFSDGTWTLAITNIDRISRFAIDLVKNILDFNNIELRIIDEDPDQSDEEELLSELFSVIHSFSCKHYSRRSAETNRTTLKKETIQYVQDRLSIGIPLTTIVVELDKLGHRPANHSEKPISYHVLKRYLDSEQIQKIIPKKENKKNSFRLFYDRHIRKTGDETKRTMKKEVVRKYREYCDMNNVLEKDIISDRAIGVFLKAEGWQKRLSHEALTTFVQLEVHGT